MSAKSALIFTLILSLLFTSQALPVARPVAKSDPVKCVEMPCVKGCCHSKACCEMAQQQKAPEVPRPLAPRPELQVAPIDFSFFALVFAPRWTTREFFILDEVSGGHLLPPLVTSCIQLI